MGTEIERKFLVKDLSVLEGRAGRVMRQAYICTGPPVSVRVRIDGASAILNIKQDRSALERAEFEYAIPLEEGEEMLKELVTGGLIEKTRYEIEGDGVVWEVDVFEGANQGLVVAEVELERVDQSLALPDWVGDEVTGDVRYLNSQLAQHPYTRW